MSSEVSVKRRDYEEGSWSVYEYVLESQEPKNAPTVHLELRGVEFSCSRDGLGIVDVRIPLQWARDMGLLPPDVLGSIPEQVRGAVLELFEQNREMAARWMTMPAVALNGETPLSTCGTENGAKSVIEIVKRLEDGIFL